MICKCSKARTLKVADEQFRAFSLYLHRFFSEDIQGHPKSIILFSSTLTQYELTIPNELMDGAPLTTQRGCGVSVKITETDLEQIRSPWLLLKCLKYDRIILRKR